MDNNIDLTDWEVVPFKGKDEIFSKSNMVSSNDLLSKKGNEELSSNVIAATTLLPSSLVLFADNHNILGNNNANINYHNINYNKHNNNNDNNYYKNDSKPISNNTVVNSEDKIVADSNSSSLLIWICPNCKRKNPQSFKFCPDCGTSNNILKSNNIITEQISLIKLAGIVGEGKYEPCETRQGGWILKNCTNNPLNADCYLKCLSENEVNVTYDNEEIGKFANINPNDTFYLLIEIEAPPKPGRYTSLWQLYLSDHRPIGPILELIVNVKETYCPTKESKINQILELGFKNRNKIVCVLKKYNWDVQHAANELTE